ncbi:PaaX family transcriptional regulator [Nakamurella flava]|uniref:PaaX family transcriptional regulator n=1 Tax=Nakamurella flava TaxID=2576308 RepID=A0A4U6QBI6_9ACTN|nr:PaaX family transcriptional regulator [Nakamurella flava]
MVVSFLGAVVRRMGNWLPIGGAIDLLDAVDLDGQTVRTAVFRLKKRGWLTPETRDGVRGYALTPHALEVLAQGDEIIWHARQPAALDDGWCIVNFSVPESMRSRRQQLRSHLTTLGFGNTGTATWIAPARMLPAAERAIAELDLTDYSAVFVGSYVAGQDLRALVAESWDLAGIDGRYRDFVATHSSIEKSLAGAALITPAYAFATYLHVVDAWRRLPFRDPGLPRDLLPGDWAGPHATRLFEHLVAALEGRALAYAVGHWPGA